MSKTVRIYQPPKNAMQSGLENTRKWVLEFEPAQAQRTDALMGWVGQGQTTNQIRMRFPTKADAIAHAKREGWTVRIHEPAVRRPRIKAYADNFAYNKVS